MGAEYLVNNEGKPLHVARGYVYYSDTSFEAGDSPIVLDVRTDLERIGINGWIICDGEGDILVELSNDGTTYGTQYSLKSGEVDNLKGETISKIRLTHSGTDSAYRVRLT